MRRCYAIQWLTFEMRGFLQNARHILGCNQFNLVILYIYSWIICVYHSQYIPLKSCFVVVFHALWLNQYPYLFDSSDQLIPRYACKAPYMFYSFCFSRSFFQPVILSFSKKNLSSRSSSDVNANMLELVALAMSKLPASHVQPIREFHSTSRDQRKGPMASIVEL